VLVVLEREEMEGGREGGREAEEACRMFSAREGVRHESSFYSRAQGKRRKKIS
jgi:hypothetical protein